MKVILAVMYTTSAVVKTRPEKKNCRTYSAGNFITPFILWNLVLATLKTLSAESHILFKILYFFFPLIKLR